MLSILNGLDEDRSYLLVRRKRRSRKNTLCKSALRFLFSNLGLLILCVLVAILGAEFYVMLELPAEEARYAAKRAEAAAIDDWLSFVPVAVWELRESNLSSAAFETKVDEYLREAVNRIVRAVDEHQYDGQIEGWSYDWSLDNALLFTISIMTSVGYGHIAPKTVAGRLFTIPYALFALATMLTMLAKVGNLLARTVTLTYSRCCCRWYRTRRLESETCDGAGQKRLSDEEVGEESYMNTNTLALPIVVNVALILGYVAIGALAFSAMEPWSVGDAAYFSFITFTTIGLGDLVPKESFLSDKPRPNFVDVLKTTFTLVYCAIGLAVLSTAFSLIQEKLGKQSNEAKGEVDENGLEIITIRPRTKQARGDGDRTGKKLADK